MEKRADNLFTNLESIRGILDRIAQSQTDKMVRGGADIQHCEWSGADVECVLNMSAGHTNISGRCGSAEALSEGRDCGAGREPGGSDPGGSCLPQHPESQLTTLLSCDSHCICSLISPVV